MRFSFLSGKIIAVLGLGRTGFESVQKLQQAGIEVWVWDDQPAVREKAACLSLSVVDLHTADLSRVSGLLISPGIAHTYPTSHPVAERAKQVGCPLISDIDMLVQDVPNPRCIGVTGTNGKSTTTALIHHILAAARLPTVIGGNFGPAALSLPVLPDHGVYVLELSSYQLELCQFLQCDVAILLNITPDHLVRHGGMSGYVSAKKRLFDLQKKDESLAFIGVDTKDAHRIYQDVSGERAQNLYCFGAVTESDQAIDMPDLIYKEGRLQISLAAKTKPLFRNFPAAGLCLTGNSALQGQHNAENMAASALAAAAMGVSWTVIESAFQSFPGLAHRMQPISQTLEYPILCINDSKATNAEAASKALTSFDTIFWIAGGQAKEGGIDNLREHLGSVIHSFLIGESCDIFAQTLDNICPVTHSQTLAHAVEDAFRMAKSYLLDHPQARPVILLSPAAASWDQFQSFEDRGHQFCDLVVQEMSLD